MKRNHFNALYLLFITTCYISYTEAAECDASSGPNGARQCIKAFAYDDYQWATCRTNSYIKLMTNGRDYCNDQSRTYCLYQCMLDKFGKVSGDVYSSCWCSPNTASQRAMYSVPYIVLLVMSTLLVS
jgi:hypothetical protein